MQPEKMVRMANQIATFFQTQPGGAGDGKDGDGKDGDGKDGDRKDGAADTRPTDTRAERVAAHINDFWEPRMRMQLLTHARAGGAGLSPLALDACAHVRPPADA